MMKNLFFNIIILFFSLYAFSQNEKRLALVIGNANYEKGELKNPVNDARLIASSLDSLNFDVILKENIETQNDFKLAILEFGKKRPNYDVAFVYYAGHGVQISNENYLLPTKQDYTSEDEVELFGVSVQDILKYLRSQTDQVNILILDACRDNPFENNWNKTRSIAGQGLAKIPPPTGSLIAFSTDSGQTAPDGEGENSIYTISLAKNMLLEQTTIDQVFRNVRSEILSLSNGEQRPVEATQLTGEAFYLNPSDFKEDLKKVEDILDEENGDYLEGLAIIEKVLSKNNLVNAQILKGRLLTEMGNYEKAQIEFENLLLRDSLNVDVYFHYSTIFEEEKKYKNAIEIYKKAISINPNESSLYYYLTTPLEELGMLEEAEENYLKAIELDPNNEDYYFGFANFYANYSKQYEKSKSQLLKLLEINPKNIDALNNLGAVYRKYFNDDKNGEKYYLRAIEIDTTASYPLNNLGDIYNNLGQFDKALLYLNRAIKTDSNFHMPYYNKAQSYIGLKLYKNAEKNLLKVIELKPNNEDYYADLGDLYDQYLNEPEMGISQYLKILEIDPKNERALNNIGVTYQYTIKDFEKAIEYYMQVIEINPKNVNTIYNLANLNYDIGEYNKSIEFYNKLIEINPVDSDNYFEITSPLEELGLYEEAEKNYLKAIELEPKDNNYRDYLIKLYVDHLNNLDKAIDLINQGIKVNSEWERYFNKYLAEIHFENLNEDEQALKLINKALKDVEDSDYYASFYELRGKIFQSLNIFESAEDDFKKSISLDATEVNHYFNLTNFYISTSQLEKAEEMILEAIDLSRNDPDGYYKLYTIELIKKNNFKALEFLTVSIQKYEDSLLNEEEYYISDFDNLNRVELEDLYIKRAELKLNLIGTNNSSCEDLNYALKINEDEGRKEMIKEKILVNCSN